MLHRRTSPQSSWACAVQALAPGVAWAPPELPPHDSTRQLRASAPPAPPVPPAPHAPLPHRLTLVGREGERRLGALLVKHSAVGEAGGVGQRDFRACSSSQQSGGRHGGLLSATAWREAASGPRRRAECGAQQSGGSSCSQAGLQLRGGKRPEARREDGEAGFRAPKQAAPALGRFQSSVSASVFFTTSPSSVTASTFFQPSSASSTSRLAPGGTSPPRPSSPKPSASRGRGACVS
jgi:hypothetical protein